MTKAKEVTYGLRSEFEPLNGARVNLPDGSDYDVKAALDRGNGKLKTDDPVLQQIFDGTDYLERTSATKGTPTARPNTSNDGGQDVGAAAQGGEQ